MHTPSWKSYAHSISDQIIKISRGNTYVYKDRSIQDKTKLVQIHQTVIHVHIYKHNNFGITIF